MNVGAASLAVRAARRAACDTRPFLAAFSCYPSYQKPSPTHKNGYHGGHISDWKVPSLLAPGVTSMLSLWQA